MIPKPVQFLLLIAIAIGAVFPRTGGVVFTVGLLALAVWWLRRVLALLLGE